MAFSSAILLVTAKNPTVDRFENYKENCKQKTFWWKLFNVNRDKNICSGMFVPKKICLIARPIIPAQQTGSSTFCTGHKSIPWIHVSRRDSLFSVCHENAIAFAGLLKANWYHTFFSLRLKNHHSELGETKVTSIFRPHAGKYGFNINAKKKYHWMSVLIWYNVSHNVTIEHNSIEVCWQLASNVRHFGSFRLWVRIDKIYVIQ